MELPSLMGDSGISGPAWWQNVVTWVSNNSEIVAIVSIIALVLVVALFCILVFLVCKIRRIQRASLLPVTSSGGGGTRREKPSPEFVSKKYRSHRDNRGLTTSTSEDETTPLVSYQNYNGYTEPKYQTESSHFNTNSESAATGSRLSPIISVVSTRINQPPPTPQPPPVSTKIDLSDDEGPPPIAPARRRSSAARTTLPPPVAPSIPPPTAKSRDTSPLRESPPISPTGRPLTPSEATRRRSSTFNRNSPAGVFNSRIPTAPVRRKSAATRLAKDLPPLGSTGEMAATEQNSRPRSVSIAENELPNNITSIERNRTRSASTTDIPRRYETTEREEVWL
ncbi:uncharacterized protein LOC141906905 [Tubulanus polymorphus]|uniref:uncharacterized protein LOC141906905 n=1 Tax=Tubulanus polymorphus TaxID=672921 RepID=UPI003DA65F5C